VFISTLLLAMAPLATQPALQGAEIPAHTEVQTTASGLQYSVLAPGDGLASPRRGDRVLVHYTGWLEDGTMFDSSHTRGKPASFGIGQVIEGWNEALELMTVGARFKLTVPFQLAYGEGGRPPRIPPSSNMTYVLELVEISARVPDFLPLDETVSESTESGLKMQWLTREQGNKRGPKDTIWLEYEFWDVEGVCHFATSMQPKPVMLTPRNTPYKFFAEVLALMGEGDDLLLEVPPNLAFGDKPMSKIPANSVTIWRLRLRRVFKRPAFEMPPEDELVTTNSGLQYRILRKGHGRRPKIANRVQVHYSGWLPDGTPFDSSYDTNKPASFSLSGVIAGWTEGVRYINEGGVIQLVIPGNLGFGRAGSPPKIGPNATLVYNIELIQIL
jgi:FKBP-type peptidyl-prolyl cis-trans isomerase